MPDPGVTKVRMVTMTEARARLASLVQAAAAGEEVVIAKGGKPVARLVAVEQPSSAAAPERKPPPRRAGRLKGRIWVADDFDDPLPEKILRHFRGEGDERGDEDR